MNGFADWAWNGVEKKNPLNILKRTPEMIFSHSKAKLNDDRGLRHGEEQKPVSVVQANLRKYFVHSMLASTWFQKHASTVSACVTRNTRNISWWCLLCCLRVEPTNNRALLVKRKAKRAKRRKQVLVLSLFETSNGTTSRFVQSTSLLINELLICALNKQKLLVKKK